MFPQNYSAVDDCPDVDTIWTIITCRGLNQYCGKQTDSIVQLPSTSGSGSCTVLLCALLSDIDTTLSFPGSIS